MIVFRKLKLYLWPAKLLKKGRKKVYFYTNTQSISISFKQKEEKNTKNNDASVIMERSTVINNTSNEKKLKWFKARKRTTYVFYSQHILLGIDYSITFSYLYLYLKDVLQTEKVNFFYSAISSIFPISTIIACLILGKMFDRLRNLRQILVLCLSLIHI